jgi:hypothetical protein
MLQHAQNEDSNNEKRSPTAPTTWNYYNNPQTTTATVANNYFTIRLKQKKIPETKSQTHSNIC